MWFDVFMIACGLIVVVGVCGLLVDRYWLVWDWWPLVGWEWRAERRGYCFVCGLDGGRHYALHADERQLEATRREIAAVIDLPGPATPRTERAPSAGWLTASTPGEASAADRAGEFYEDDPDDESWADELHAINQELHGNVIQGQFGDLSRPMEQLTHYEVEAVIVQLGRADWLPAAA